MNDRTPDQELARRVAVSQDAAAFAEIVRRHEGPIRAFLRRLMTGDNAAADDLAQETFLAAYQKMYTFKGNAKLGTWLHTIAYRQFIGLKRKHTWLQVMAEVPEDGQDGGQAVQAEILARQLMSQLNEEDRACMTLSYAVGMSHADISAVVGQPVGSIKARIHRAKIKLHKWLENHDHTLQTPTPAQETQHAG